MKKEIVRREFLKWKIKDYRFSKCQKRILEEFQEYFCIRTLKNWWRKFNRGKWNLKDKSSKPKKMSMTSGTNHLQLITGLKETINNETQEEWYSINVNCKNSFGNSNTKLIKFYIKLS